MKKLLFCCLFVALLLTPVTAFASEIISIHSVAGDLGGTVHMK